ncbi:hypothetical protein AYI68_g6729 [Smittium mucronatum]|uniref:Uncharacterized protein n=1 Tax=Smittium mucronatum TaxID=133383 RepID=A0A1R0GQS9_9FUNG|nr:hypothetical protein AYI68_g6729 [Smittium mucronatum]
MTMTMARFYRPCFLRLLGSGIILAACRRSDWEIDSFTRYGSLIDEFHSIVIILIFKRSLLVFWATCDIKLYGGHA